MPEQPVLKQDTVLVHLTTDSRLTAELVVKDVALVRSEHAFKLLSMVIA